MPQKYFLRGLSDSWLTLEESVLYNLLMVPWCFLHHNKYVFVFDGLKTLLHRTVAHTTLQCIQRFQSVVWPEFRVVKSLLGRLLWDTSCLKVFWWQQTVGNFIKRSTVQKIYIYWWAQSYDQISVNWSTLEEVLQDVMLITYSVDIYTMVLQWLVTCA